MAAPASADPRWSYELGRSAVMDMGCYRIHALRQLSNRVAGGEPTLSGARGVERSRQVDESFDLEVEFPSRVTGSVSSSMVADHVEMTLRLVGDRGEVYAPDYALQYGDDRVLVTTEDGTTVEHLGLRSTYTYQLDAFADHLAGGTALAIGPDDAVANMAFIDAAYTAAGLKLR
ncbi:hypothetical protein BH92_11085 [Rhodococcoides fascians A21d2]|uniref:Gfo/Idh/MocA family protein n=1 Tax=Nocardiaceae TaxID=85025 RepID=UPI00113FE515|nr:MULTISPECIES: Gfo/Idh/MocA family oxidoreductase [Rhodococcus]QII00344.1 hypothetical protein BH92_11085 [Rhodococcus fascians A21d2]